MSLLCDGGVMRQLGKGPGAAVGGMCFPPAACRVLRPRAPAPEAQSGRFAIFIDKTKNINNRLLVSLGGRNFWRSDVLLSWGSE